MACNVQIPVDDIAEEVKQLLNLDQYVKQNNGTANNLTLKGGVTLDSETKRDLCDALSDCFDDKFVEKNGGTLTNGVLSTPTINGAVSLDSKATESLCSALEKCLATLVPPIKDGLCTLGVTNKSSYTVTDTDDVIVSSGGTITFPSSIPVGRVFTVIQATDTAVVLASDGAINPPLDKTLTMYGKNAVATVIKTGADVFYVSGDMQ